MPSRPELLGKQALGVAAGWMRWMQLQLCRAPRPHGKQWPAQPGWAGVPAPSRPACTGGARSGTRSTGLPSSLPWFLSPRHPVPGSEGQDARAPVPRGAVPETRGWRGLTAAPSSREASATEQETQHLGSTRNSRNLCFIHRTRGGTRGGQDTFSQAYHTSPLSWSRAGSPCPARGSRLQRPAQPSSRAGARPRRARRSVRGTLRVGHTCQWRGPEPVWARAVLGLHSAVESTPQRPPAGPHCPGTGLATPMMRRDKASHGAAGQG